MNCFLLSPINIKKGVVMTTTNPVNNILRVYEKYADLHAESDVPHDDVDDFMPAPKEDAHVTIARLKAWEEFENKIKPIKKAIAMLPRNQQKELLEKTNSLMINSEEEGDKKKESFYQELSISVSLSISLNTSRNLDLPKNTNSSIEF